MPTREELEGLLERVERATGEDDALNVSLYAVLWERYVIAEEIARVRLIPNFTASIDAAVALVERVLGAKWWRLGRGQVTAYHAEIRIYTGGAEYQAFHGQLETAPLALLQALLRAMLASSEGKG